MRRSGNRIDWRIVDGYLPKKSSEQILQEVFGDVILAENFDLLSVIGCLFVVMLIYNIATGNFILGFGHNSGIIVPDHSMEHSRYVYGRFAATLAGGCPLRQLVLQAGSSGWA